MIDYILDTDGILGHFVYTAKGNLNRSERWDQCRKLGRKYGVKDHQWKRTSNGGYTTNWRAPSNAQVKAWMARKSY